MFAALLPAVGRLIVTRASNARSAEPEALAAAGARASRPRCRSRSSRSLDEALDAAWRASPRIVVAGSIFLLGDVLKRGSAARDTLRAMPASVPAC